jgi:hypothetical protein
VAVITRVPGEQLRRLEQRAADLGEDVGVEVIGADVAIRAARVFAAGASASSVRSCRLGAAG